MYQQASGVRVRISGVPATSGKLRAEYFQARLHESGFEGMDLMMSEPDDMDLPRGKTCGDCVHFKRCAFLVGAKAEYTRCDWSPSLFHAVHVNSERKRGDCHQF